MDVSGFNFRELIGMLYIDKAGFSLNQNFPINMPNPFLGQFRG